MLFVVDVIIILYSWLRDKHVFLGRCFGSVQSYYSVHTLRFQMSGVPAFVYVSGANTLAVHAIIRKDGCLNKSTSFIAASLGMEVNTNFVICSEDTGDGCTFPGNRVRVGSYVRPVFEAFGDMKVSKDNLSDDVDHSSEEEESSWKVVKTVVDSKIRLKYETKSFQAAYVYHVTGGLPGDLTPTQKRDARRNYKRRFRLCNETGRLQRVRRLREKHGLRPVMPLSLAKKIRLSSTLWRTVLTSEQAFEIIRSLHNIETTHDRRDRLEKRLETMYIIHDLRSKVKEVIDGCEICARYSQAPKGPPKAIISSFVNDLVMFDCTTLDAPDSKGYKYLLLVCDHFSKFLWAAPLKTKTKNEVVSAIRKIFLVWPTPRRFHSDNGGEFVNDLMVDLCDSLNTVHSTSLPRNPQCQGLVEVRNKVIKTKISKRIAQEGNWHHKCGRPYEWTKYLDDIVAEENDNPVTMYEGITPYYIMFGRPRKAGDHLPSNCDLSLLSEYLQERQVRHAQKKELVTDTEVRFEVGQEVYVYANHLQRKRKQAESTWSVRAEIWILSPKSLNNPTFGAFYKLRWVSPGLSGEAAGSVSKRFYPHGKLKAALPCSTPKKKKESAKDASEDVCLTSNDEGSNVKKIKKGGKRPRTPKASGGIASRCGSERKRQKKTKTSTAPSPARLNPRTPRSQRHLQIVGSLVSVRASWWGRDYWADVFHGNRQQADRCWFTGKVKGWEADRKRFVVTGFANAIGYT